MQPTTPLPSTVGQWLRTAFTELVLTLSHVISYLSAHVWKYVLVVLDEAFKLLSAIGQHIAQRRWAVSTSLKVSSADSLTGSIPASSPLSSATPQTTSQNVSTTPVSTTPS